MGLINEIKKCQKSRDTATLYAQAQAKLLLSVLWLVFLYSSITFKSTDFLENKTLSDPLDWFADAFPSTNYTMDNNHNQTS